MSIPDRALPLASHTRGYVLATPVGLLLALTVAVAATGCDPGHGVTYENRTDHQVTVFRDGVRAFVLEVSEKQTYSLFEFPGTMLFEARDENGRVLYSESLTWDELKERSWKIVIAEAAPAGGSPTPEAREPAPPSFQ